MHLIEIVDDLLVILDEDGHGLDARELRNYPDARRQVEAWVAEYSIDAEDLPVQNSLRTELSAGWRDGCRTPATLKLTATTARADGGNSPGRLG